MATLEIGGQLDFVDGKEGNVKFARHRLDRGDPEAWICRFDFLFAGDERHRVGADPLDRAVIDLAGQEPQRQPNDARGMRKHSLDSEMRLAGIGRTQDGSYA